MITSRTRRGQWEGESCTSIQNHISSKGMHNFVPLESAATWFWLIKQAAASKERKIVTDLIQDVGF